MIVHVIGGFLGAGKTTAIRRLVSYFDERGARVAVVTNDQGCTLVDTEMVRGSSAMVREIGGGCLCCKYPELESALAAAADSGVNVALVEAVGSCTDLVATVLAPMAKRQPDRFRPAPLSVLVDPWRVREMGNGAFAPDVQYLFRKQIEEADVIVLTRADLAPPDVTEVVREINAEAAIVAFSATTGEGLSTWLAARPARPAAPLVIDYDRYAAAEASLGWLNGLAVVESALSFSPASVVRKLFSLLRDVAIVHLKVAVLEPGVGAAALVRPGGAVIDDLDTLPAETRAMRLLVNGRIAAPPRELEDLVRRGLALAAAPAVSSWEQLAAFEPGRPTPVYRFASRSGNGDEVSSGNPPCSPASRDGDDGSERLESARQALLEREMAARLTAETAAQRSTFLAAASRALSASLDYQSTLTRVAELAVPSVADFCAVYVEEPGIRSHPVAVAYHDPQALDLAREFAAEYADCVTQQDKPGACSVLQTCLAGSMDSVEIGPRDECCSYKDLARRLSLYTSLAVPLVAREHALGIVLFAYRSRRKDLDADLALAQDLAGRAAFAVDNARLYTEAQQAIRVRDEFLSIASHELRTPATSLVLGVQMLLRLADAGRSRGDAALPLTRSVLEKLDRQSQLLEHLINRLLDVARIQSGQLELDLEPNVDFAAVTRDATNGLLEHATQSGCTLELRVEQAVTGEFDRVRLAQVVSNLVENAIRYGAGAPIEIAIGRAGGLARLAVRDHGVGIASERQTEIFEAYKRASSARHYGGLGLGLYIVRQIVVAHGGTIRVDSAPNAGATFVAELPCDGCPASGSAGA
jgi:signal transduction histidine kinase/Ni2+-binding GTPase involved in maturation of urease and hydrogenase